MIQPRFQVNVPEWDQKVREFAAVSGTEILEEYRNQARLLDKEMIERTPPLSGKTIVRTLEARGAKLSINNLEVQDLSARKVGMRRVEKDIRRVIYGIDGAQFTQTRSQFIKGQQAVGFGVMQKCEGKVAIRIFATKAGDVYGTDTANFKPNATDSDMAATHREHKVARGHVSVAGQRTRDVGRWKWVNLLITEKKNAERYTAKVQKRVGQAKGGWAAGFMALGGKCAKWIKDHAGAGDYVDNLKPGVPEPVFTFINKSKWAEGGDEDRVIEMSMKGRAKALAGAIDRKIKDLWRKGGKL